MQRGPKRGASLVNCRAKGLGLSVRRGSDLCRESIDIDVKSSCAMLLYVAAEAKAIYARVAGFP